MAEPVLPADCVAKWRTVADALYEALMEAENDSKSRQAALLLYEDTRDDVPFVPLFDSMTGRRTDGR